MTLEELKLHLDEVAEVEVPDAIDEGGTDLVNVIMGLNDMIYSLARARREAMTAYMSRGEVRLQA